MTANIELSDRPGIDGIHSKRVRGPMDYEINWSIYNKFMTDLVSCRCGRTFRSHTQFTTGTPERRRKGHIVSRDPCPSCGRNNLILRVKSARVTWEVRF